MKNYVVEERFEYRKIPCVIVMRAGGFRTAYIGIRNNSNFYGMSISDLDNYFECPGGITYAESTLVDQNDKDIWWIGFDGNHSWNRPDFYSARLLFAGDEDNLKYLENCMENQAIWSTGEILITKNVCVDACKKMVDTLLGEDDE